MIANLLSVTAHPSVDVLYFLWYCASKSGYANIETFKQMRTTIFDECAWVGAKSTRHRHLESSKDRYSNIEDTYSNSAHQLCYVVMNLKRSTVHKFRKYRHSFDILSDWRSEHYQLVIFTCKMRCPCSNGSVSFARESYAVYCCDHSHCRRCRCIVHKQQH